MFNESHSVDGRLTSHIVKTLLHLPKEVGVLRMFVPQLLLVLLAKRLGDIEAVGFEALAHTLQVVPPAHMMVNLVLVVVHVREHVVHLLLEMDHFSVLLVRQVHLRQNFRVRVVFLGVLALRLACHFFKLSELFKFLPGLLHRLGLHCLQVGGVLDAARPEDGHHFFPPMYFLPMREARFCHSEAVFLRAEVFKLVKHGVSVEVGEILVHEVEEQIFFRLFSPLDAL